MENYMKLEVPAKSVNEAFVRAVVSAFAVQLDLSIEELADIKTAVSEAVTNSIVHGYANMKGIIKIVCRVIDNFFEVEISDFGVGIEDIGMAMQPLFTTMPEAERSGMGFTVMQTFMDELSVKSTPGEGTVIKMKKRIGG
ncbi:MAG: anti-sigma F factor [Clostridia bacterium]|nr:anti-sigma F factor [Clostridia bacterium]